MSLRLDELRSQARGGHIDRPALIKTLRKLRMSAITAGDTQAIAEFDAPVEVMADRMLAERKKE